MHATKLPLPRSTNACVREGADRLSLGDYCHAPRVRGAITATQYVAVDETGMVRGGVLMGTPGVRRRGGAASD